MSCSHGTIINTSCCHGTNINMSAVKTSSSTDTMRWNQRRLEWNASQENPVLNVIPSQWTGIYLFRKFTEILETVYPNFEGLDYSRPKAEIHYFFTTLQNLQLSRDFRKVDTLTRHFNHGAMTTSHADDGAVTAGQVYSSPVIVRHINMSKMA